jgi:tRNA-dihydrouridine synthase B
LYGLAPMAGVSDWAYRTICYEKGADFAYKEMVEAAKLMGNRYGWIDINAGCSVRKIVRRGAGAALLKDLKHFSRMISEIRKNVSCKLSVKTRLGWDKDDFSEIYAMLCDSGVDMVAVHGRTAKQLFEGKSKWDIDIREKIIPVYLSGDLFNTSDVENAMSAFNYDGAMIARGSIGNPWIFSELKDEKYVLNDKERLDTIIRHIDLMSKDKGEGAYRYFRKFIAGYTRNFRDAHKLRDRIMKIEDINEVKDEIRNFFSGEHDV